MFPSRLFAVRRNVQIEAIQIDQCKLFVVDGIFENPGSVRLLADSLDYGLYRSRGQYRYYPGERAQVSVWPADLIHFVINLLNASNGTELSANQFVSYPATFTRMNPALIAHLHPNQIVPHLDMESIYSGVVFLSESDTAESGGTAFYRHKVTGLAFVPQHPDKQIGRIMRDHGYSPLKTRDYLEFRKSLMYTNISRYSSNGSRTGIEESTLDWELLCRVQQRYNRLLLFPSNVFHSPLYSTVTVPAEARITQNLFLTRA